jgi:gamma-glutamyltranspeptidase / glutathione hydrolase
MSMPNQRWRQSQHRGLVIDRRGMVATAQPLASAAGMNVLREGGNAADAILAAAATLGVTLGSTNSLGGDMFCLYYDAKTRAVTGFNGNGAAGSGATLEAMRAQGLKYMPARGPLTVTVPGAVDGYCELHKRFGTMPLSRLFADAIEYADNGFPIGQQLSRIIGTFTPELREEVEWSKVYLPGGRPPKAGENFVQKDYAWSLRQVAEGGRDAFYEGEVGKRIIATVEARGGLLTSEDLRVHRTEVYSPISTTYRGKTVYETQPPSQGFVVLEMLNLLEPTDLQSLGWGSAAAIHQMVEAKKLAFADRWEYMGDPRFVDTPLDTLIDKRYAADRRRSIDPVKAMTAAAAGSPSEAAADTTYLCAVDGQGNAASFIHTIYHQFGSGVVAAGTGITLTNRGRAFVLDDVHPNRIAPRKRTMHTLNCYLLTEDDELTLVGGTPGADSQPQWNVQVLTDLLDFGLNEQQAAESPKWVSIPGTIHSEMGQPYVLQMEDGFGDEVVGELERMGHRVALQPRWGLRGSVQLIRRDPESGALFGASDPGSDGMAIGY